MVCAAFASVKSYLIDINEPSVINGVSKAVGNSLFTLELDEYVFLHARLEQVDVDDTRDKFSIRIAVLVGQYRDVAAIIWLKLTTDLFEEILIVRLFNITRSLKML